MNIRQRRQLKAAAARSLQNAAYDPKKLVLIHTAAVLIFFAVLAIVDYLLEQQIGSTGGLSGLGTRTILATAQQVLQLSEQILIPFWQIGYLYAMLRLSRGETAGPETLLTGFRRFFPFLRLHLIQFASYAGIALACSYVACNVIFFTPWGSNMMNSLIPLLSESEAVDMVALEEAIMAAMDQIMLPLLAIFGVIFLSIAAPMYFRYRMAQYLLMDDPQMGALSALRASRHMTRGNRIALLRLDLSFWWFYLLDGMITALWFGSSLLPLLGITLPWSAEVNLFVFYGLYMICQLGLYLGFRNRVEVTYAHAYSALRQPQTVQRGEV